MMRTGPGKLSFPLHWAAAPETSFVVSPVEYCRALESAGFAISKERDRGAFAHAFFRQAAARAAQGGTPPLGLHILMKSDVSQKLTNVISNIERGLIAPVELICRAR